VRSWSKRQSVCFGRQPRHVGHCGGCGQGVLRTKVGPVLRISFGTEKKVLKMRHLSSLRIMLSFQRQADDDSSKERYSQLRLFWLFSGALSLVNFRFFVCSHLIGCEFRLASFSDETSNENVAVHTVLRRRVASVCCPPW
jgi:hypothetical protein